MYKGWYPGSQNSKAGKAWERLVRNLYLDLGEKHPSSVFLAVSGRSGTTWASDIASYGSESRYVFAPVHQRKVGVTGVLRSGHST